MPSSIIYFCVPWMEIITMRLLLLHIDFRHIFFGALKTLQKSSAEVIFNEQSPRCCFKIIQYHKCETNYE